jgi:cyclohexanone monooxygenase
MSEARTAGMQEARMPLDVAIVGAGLAGLYALYRLRGAGFAARAYEAGSGIGGTWFWNRYPGARCDIESLEYSYSFSEALDQEWQWPERYATQPEILRYINHVADRFDLRRDVQLETRITAAHFDSARDLWALSSRAGVVATARHCIMATGNLSTPRVPDFRGLERFAGKWYHSGLWPQEGVDFSGQRVGVVGTGSTAIQMIPLIARQARHLYVFQRTANFSIPARNAPMDAEREAAHKSRYPERRKEARMTGFGVSGYPAPAQSALEASPEERRRRYEELWQRGGTIGFLSCYADFLVDAAANETAAEFVRDKIRSIVKDPVTAELLCPKDHPIGTKRLCLDTGYYETFNRENVSLVDVRSAPIEEITASGIQLRDGKFYELDAIAFATGFDAMTGALREIEIRVDGAQSLAQRWSAGPRTYLGLAVAGFPNLFLITGPGSPSVKSQMIVSIEQHVDWVADCLEHLRANAFTRIEADPEAEDRWVAHLSDVAEATLYPRANSWYVGANIPGKPRVFMPYVAGVGAYRKKCDEVAAKGYAGFKLTR